MAASTDSPIQAQQFWTTDRRGAVEIATFSNPPHNYLDKPVIDELEQLVVQWRDPSIRAVVIQSRDEDAGFFTQYSVEELYGLASDPTLSRYAGALVRGYKAIFGDNPGTTKRPGNPGVQYRAMPPSTTADHGAARRRSQGHTGAPPGRTGDDLIIGYDGKPRCAWAGAGDTALGGYHDEVWGTRTYDESALFEALTLGVFQAGLSWAIVFNKRDAFRRAFHGFDTARVAAMTERDVDRLLQDPSIIRNRAKIQATVQNARAMRSASPTLAALARSYASTRKRAPRSIAGLPTSTPQADAFAKQLKSQGYRFVGPTSVYAFMQNVGVINDHIHGCFRASDC